MMDVNDILNSPEMKKLLDEAKWMLLLGAISDKEIIDSSGVGEDVTRPFYEFFKVFYDHGVEPDIVVEAIGKLKALPSKKNNYERKEKMMDKNEKLKDTNCICVFKDGDEVKAVAMRNVRNVFLEGSNLFTDNDGSGSKVVARASAKCSPDDIFDFNIGAKLALDRLYEGYDFTPRSKELYSGKIIFVDPKQENNEFKYGCSEWEVKDGLITSLGYANSNRNLRILRNMPCSKLAERVKDMYFPYSSDWSKRNKVLYLASF